MTVRFDRRGPTYAVDSERGRTYTVDLAEDTCSCPDFEQHGDELADGCKHLRRVHLELAAGHTPHPTGQFEGTTRRYSAGSAPMQTD